MLDFVKRLPANLEIIFRDRKFVSFLNRIGKYYNINEELFFAAFEEAKEVLITNINILEQTIIENQDQRNNFIRSLNGIGFTGSSLLLKGATMELLWDKVKNPKRNKTVIEKVFFFFKNPVVKALRKALTCLNQVMDSLKIVIPGLEALKEWKDIGESYISIADEG